VVRGPYHQVMRTLRPALLILLLLLLPTSLHRLVVTIPTAPCSVVRGIIPAGTSLSAALAAHLSPMAIHGLVEVSRPVYDLSRVVAGHPFGLVRSSDGFVRAFTYGIDTLYGHLASIHVRPGRRVTQGLCIGSVGATGLASGPHLDYRMFLGGIPVNPLRTQPLPAPALAHAELAAFNAERDRALTLLGPASERRSARASR
jgi:Peptidase family M23